MTYSYEKNLVDLAYWDHINGFWVNKQWFFNANVSSLTDFQRYIFQCGLLVQSSNKYKQLLYHSYYYSMESKLQ